MINGKPNVHNNNGYEQIDKSSRDGIWDGISNYIWKHKDNPLTEANIRKKLSSNHVATQVSALKDLLTHHYLNQYDQDTETLISSSSTSSLQVPLLLPDVVKTLSSDSLHVKRKAHSLITLFASHHKEVTLLSINSLQRDISSREPGVRSEAIRALTSLSISEASCLVEEVVVQSIGSGDPFLAVRALHGGLKLVELDSDMAESISRAVISRLSDGEVIVKSCSLYVLSELWKKKLINLSDLHSHIRNLIQSLLNLEFPSQALGIEMLTEYFLTYSDLNSSKDAENFIETVKTLTKRSNCLSVVWACIECLICCCKKKSPREIILKELIRCTYTTENKIVPLKCFIHLQKQFPSWFYSFEIISTIGLVSEFHCETEVDLRFELVHNIYEDSLSVAETIPESEIREQIGNLLFRVFKEVSQCTKFVSSEKVQLKALRLLSCIVNSTKNQLCMSDGVVTFNVNRHSVESLQEQKSFLELYRQILVKGLDVLLNAVSSYSSQVSAEAVVGLRTVMHNIDDNMMTNVMRKNLLTILCEQLVHITSATARISVIYLLSTYQYVYPCLMPNTMLSLVSSFHNETDPDVAQQILSLGFRVWGYHWLNSKNKKRESLELLPKLTYLLLHLFRLGHANPSYSVRDSTRLYNVIYNTLSVSGEEEEEANNHRAFAENKLLIFSTNYLIGLTSPKKSNTNVLKEVKTSGDNSNQLDTLFFSIAENINPKCVEPDCTRDIEKAYAPPEKKNFASSDSSATVKRSNIPAIPNLPEQDDLNAFFDDSPVYSSSLNRGVIISGEAEES